MNVLFSDRGSTVIDFQSTFYVYRTHSVYRGHILCIEDTFSARENVFLPVYSECVAGTGGRGGRGGGGGRYSQGT